MKTIRFHFEDNGQDCLWWETTDDGLCTEKVVDANLQASVWASGDVYVNMGEPHGPGDQLAYTNDLPRSLQDGYTLWFKHRIVKVEHLEREMAA